jgi:hypothetical protein
VNGFKSSVAKDFWFSSSIAKTKLPLWFDGQKRTSSFMV